MADRRRSRSPLPIFARRAFASAVGLTIQPTPAGEGRAPAAAATPAAGPHGLSASGGGATGHGGRSADRAPPRASGAAALGARTVAKGAPSQRMPRWLSSLDGARPTNRPTVSSAPTPRDTRGEQPAGALPGLRVGAPGRLPARPPVMDLSTDAARERAVDDLITGFYADSSGPAVRARRSCYARILALWGLRPWPLTAHTIVCLAAGLKARRYRSAASVLSQLKVDSERLGQDITAAHRRLLTDAVRSCNRGLGPTLTAKALEFERFRRVAVGPGALDTHRTARTCSGDGGRVVVASS